MKETYEAIIVDCEDVLLLRHHVTEAATSRVLEGDARSFGTKDTVNVVPVVKLVIEPFRNSNGLGRISVLDDDEMVRLEKRSPHLEEIEVSDGGNDDVELVFQQRRRVHRESDGVRRVNHGSKGREMRSDRVGGF